MAYFKYQGKRCYYDELGEGNTLLFLHGNTASSRMFASIADLYKENYKIVLLDFLGHGQSDRLDHFPVDLWFDESMQVIAFLEHVQYKKVNIIGSSGGAIVALNVALERPDLVNRLIADSFEGETPFADYVKDIKAEREASKHDNAAKMFYIYNHGDNWEQVVDNDTNAVYTHYETIGKFFHKPLELLEMPVLLTGSKEDEFVTGDFYETTYAALLKKIKNGQMHLFDKGGHPSILSNSDEFFKAANIFFQAGRNNDKD